MLIVIAVVEAAAQFGPDRPSVPFLRGGHAVDDPEGRAAVASGLHDGRFGEVHRLGDGGAMEVESDGLAVIHEVGARHVGTGGSANIRRLGGATPRALDDSIRTLPAPP